MVAMAEEGYHEKQLPVTWKIFEKEILTQFGPTEYKDFDKVLSQI